MNRFETWLKKIGNSAAAAGVYVFPTIMIHEEGVFLFWLKMQVTLLDWCEE